MQRVLWRTPKQYPFARKGRMKSAGLASAWFSLGRILVVVYTWRGERVRLISARPATRREARQYEEGI